LIASLPEALESDDPLTNLREAVAQRTSPDQIDTILQTGHRMPKSLDVSDDLSAQLSRHRAIIGRMNENRERNSAFLTQMVEEARKNSKKS